MREYPIIADDAIETLVAERPSTYGVKRTLPDGREFVYCYTALTSLLKGGCVSLQTGGGALGQNPRAVVPTTLAIHSKMGIAAETVTTAGGIWVQTYGRCTYARVEGSNDVAVGAFLKSVTTTQYMELDHATVATVEAIAIAETAETAAVAAQTDTTNCDADNTVFLLDRWADVS